MTRTDIHTHLVPVPAADVLAAAGLRDAGGRLAAGEHVIGPPGLYAPERLVEWLAGAGLERALVSVPPPLYRQHLAPEQAERWVRALNDGLRELTRGYPALVPLAYLPLEHPDLAVAELGRLGERSVGFTASAGGRSVSLADDRLAPLWAGLVALDAPLVLHPGASPDERLDELYLGNLLGNPVETGLAAAQLLLGGVLQRHPGLRIALVHCGGVLPAVLGRYQRGLDTDRPGVPRRDADLREEAARLWVDCLAHDAAALDLAVGVVGEEHLLVGSDWPFPMGTDDPLALLAHRGPAAADRVAADNAAAFLGAAAGRSGA
ncbi:amidohydrolase family protein [Georgenia thermotolerans]|uniref:Amidohydrolase family protein n=1 Tax=Georgenia thermotolerans TaxID=527326 RepID=A0A7J5UV05_9MICO|nr:amidohydrolase family protein [Georgenia thermotolerans]KAE8766100.1 amidohydrolase family protein [Georgenia thermotolerans]